MTTLTFTYDATNPTSTVTFPASGGSYNTAGWTAGCPAPGVCGTASDAVAGVQVVEVSIRRGSGNYWNGTSFASASEVFLAASGTTSWSYALPATSFPANGTYTLRVRARDNAGNVQSPSSRNFRYDTVAPTSAMAHPTAGSVYNATSWAASCAPAGICGSASDATAGVNRVELSFRAPNGLYWDGGVFASTVELFLPGVGTTSWGFGFPAANFPANGSYTLRTQAVDNAGNVQTPWSRTFTYDVNAP
jgi:hypothetical protein